jgi:hypothetical protein
MRGGNGRERQQDQGRADGLGDEATRRPAHTCGG